MELNKIIIGTMRLRDRVSSVELIRKAVDAGFNYIDTAPLYRYENDLENSETWVGEAINHTDYRDKALLSAKCATSNGGLGLGDFNKNIGFGARSAEQFGLVFQQSLDRLGVDSLDYYHLWICHTDEQFNEAFKKGGWYEGFLREREAGRVKHLGITTHADSDTIIRFLETGYFETVTLPLNVLNRTRIKAVEYCKRNNIGVIAMNPLGGGFLAADERLKELAFRYLMSIDNVRILIGFTNAEEVDYAVKMKEVCERDPVETEAVVEAVRKIVPTEEPRCTGCGYCQPCPNFIEVGTALSYYNLYKYLGMKQAKEAFSYLQWNPRYKLDSCVACGLCESRCPNALPVRDIIKDAVRLLY